MNTNTFSRFEVAPIVSTSQNERSNQDTAWLMASIEDTRMLFTGEALHTDNKIEVLISDLLRSKHQHAPVSSTNAGFDLLSVVHNLGNRSDGSEMTYELRRVSGLSLKELSSLLDVSERSLHYWMAGQNIAQKHLKNLGELISVIRYLDTGSAEDNRNKIFSPASAGYSVFDLLRKRDWQKVRDFIEKGPGRHAIQDSIDSSDAGHYWKLEKFASISESNQFSDEDDIRLPEPKSRKITARRHQLD